jgi:hypothetical protein
MVAPDTAVGMLLVRVGSLHAVDAPDGLGDLACLADLGMDEHVRR